MGFEEYKKKKRDYHAARCKHKMKVGKSKPDAKVDISTPTLGYGNKKQLFTIWSWSVNVLSPRRVYGMSS